MQTVTAGTRIRLIEMPGYPCPVEPGTLGTVLYASDWTIGVDWDNGRSLSLVPGVDRFEVIEPA